MSITPFHSYSRTVYALQTRLLTSLIPISRSSIGTYYEHQLPISSSLHSYSPSILPQQNPKHSIYWGNLQTRAHNFSSSTKRSTKPSNNTTFTSFQPPLHQASLHALTRKLKLTNPTEIQLNSYKAAITRRDVLARARTGTGKTLAYLLPSIENALSNVRSTFSSKRKIEILVLCPTRELASQIHTTSQLLAASHSNSDDSIRMHTQVMFGGVSKEKDAQKLQEKLPFVLVATPGRLLDHMENTAVGGVKFSEILGNISVLVLDEVSCR